MIWIIGGTHEAVELVDKIKGRTNYVITAATESEREFIDDENLVVCRMDGKTMESFISQKSIDLIIDVSHPYATEVTKNARDVAKICDIKYMRYVRKKIDKVEGCIYLESVEQCIEFIETIDGCVFFTTGTKNVKDFEPIKGSKRFIYRVLPSLESIGECIKNNIKMKDIIAALGPFSVELNAAMFKEFSANYVVMKDSGNNGGTVEKIKACNTLDIKAVIIGRIDEEGVYDLDEISNYVLKMH